MNNTVLDKHENSLIKELLETIETDRYLILQKKNAERILSETEQSLSGNYKKQEELKIKINLLKELKKDNHSHTYKHFSGYQSKFIPPGLTVDTSALKPLATVCYNSLSPDAIQPLTPSDIDKLTRRDKTTDLYYKWSDYSNLINNHLGLDELPYLS